MGDIAKPVAENFETLTTPPFKPKLELIDADPHTPPNMNAQTDQNIKTEGDDPKRPSTKDIVKKAPEYENSNAIEEEKVPHEGEKVKQASQDEILAQMKTEFTNKFARANRLFDIKIAAGLEQEINRNSFATKLAEDSNETVASLDKQISDSEAFLNQINSSTKVANAPKIPLGFNGSGVKQDSSFNDDVDLIILGG